MSLITLRRCSFRFVIRRCAIAASRLRRRLCRAGQRFRARRLRCPLFSCHCRCSLRYCGCDDIAAIFRHCAADTPRRHFIRMCAIFALRDTPPMPPPLRRRHTLTPPAASPRRAAFFDAISFADMPPPRCCRFSFDFSPPRCRCLRRHYYDAAIVFIFAALSYAAGCLLCH